MHCSPLTFQRIQFGIENSGMKGLESSRAINTMCAVVVRGSLRIGAWTVARRYMAQQSLKNGRFCQVGNIHVKGDGHRNPADWPRSPNLPLSLTSNSDKGSCQSRSTITDTVTNSQYRHQNPRHHQHRQPGCLILNTLLSCHIPRLLLGKFQSAAPGSACQAGCCDCYLAL